MASPERKIVPENGSHLKRKRLSTIHFQVLAVSFREATVVAGSRHESIEKNLGIMHQHYLANHLLFITDECLRMEPSTGNHLRHLLEGADEALS